MLGIRWRGLQTLHCVIWQGAARIARDLESASAAISTETKDHCAPAWPQVEAAAARIFGPGLLPKLLMSTRVE
ncbi:MAG: hypothetical protein DMG30_21000 [Acidobacteria bacterium]|nr:MAG: hypothetical protein DMG30_21000 [Acidobacteriota bacterium]